MPARQPARSPSDVTPTTAPSSCCLNRRRRHHHCHLIYQPPPPTPSQPPPPPVYPLRLLLPPAAPIHTQEYVTGLVSKKYADARNHKLVGNKRKVMDSYAGEKKRIRARWLRNKTLRPWEIIIHWSLLDELHGE